MDANLDRGNTHGREYYQSTLSGLYEEYYGKITRYIYVRVGNKAEAEDIAGDVFLKALESLGSYKERGIPMYVWLFRIAHNLVIDYFRKMRKRKTVSIDDIEIEGGTDPAAVAEQKMEIEMVTKAMEQLTQEQREVLGLRFFGGLSSREAGRVLNKSDGAIREMQRAAIEKLRNLLIVD
jgi:RNA polymerase sigma-70 factor (ECF subfamily)